MIRKEEILYFTKPKIKERKEEYAWWGRVTYVSYSKKFQHGNTLVEMMEEYLVTNIYQFYQHRMDMNMESDEFHKQLYQVLDQPCNNDTEE